MNRRCSLLLVAIAALALTGTAVAAGTHDSGLPSGIAAPAAPALDSGQCLAAPGQPPAIGTAGAIQASSSSDFILCSCKLCTKHPEVICRISPTGFSILCSDYAQTHC
jgi:hypothetical protein